MAFGSPKKASKKAVAEKVAPARGKTIKDPGIVEVRDSSLAVLSKYLETPCEGHLLAIRFSGEEGDKRPWSAYSLLGTQLCAATLAELVEAMR